MDKFRRASFDVIITARTDAHPEAVRRYKDLMLEIKAPPECQSWTDEQFADFAIDYILEVWKMQAS
jgi:hypothetical protein